jgi:predicted methyltransferase
MKKSARFRYAALGLLGFAALIAPFGTTPAKAQDYEAIVAAPDRSDADRQTDKRRFPAKMLAFTGVKPGMKVLDLVSAGGYSAELLARSVGPTGTLYAQDSQESVDRTKERFDARLKSPAVKSLVRVARNYDDPIPPEVRDLDLVTIFFSYHDLTFMPVDRAAMNKKVFAALKPGGFFVVADHSAKPGDGATVGKTLHRIEESTLRKEVEAAGFKLVAEADFLRHPEDMRDVTVTKAPTPVDEFVLKFQKP